MHPCSECVVGMVDSEGDSQAEAVLRELEGEGAEAAVAPVAQAWSALLVKLGACQTSPQTQLKKESTQI